MLTGYRGLRQPGAAEQPDTMSEGGADTPPALSAPIGTSQEQAQQCVLRRLNPTKVRGRGLGAAEEAGVGAGFGGEANSLLCPITIFWAFPCRRIHIHSTNFNSSL